MNISVIFENNDVSNFLPMAAQLSHDWYFPELPDGQSRLGYNT